VKIWAMEQIRLEPVDEVRHRLAPGRPPDQRVPPALVGGVLPRRTVPDDSRVHEIEDHAVVRDALLRLALVLPHLELVRITVHR